VPDAGAYPRIFRGGRISRHVLFQGKLIGRRPIEAPPLHENCSARLGFTQHPRFSRTASCAQIPDFLSRHPRAPEDSETAEHENNHST
jgi:hypothetical protein